MNYQNNLISLNFQSYAISPMYQKQKLFSFQISVKNFYFGQATALHDKDKHKIPLISSKGLAFGINYTTFVGRQDYCFCLILK